MGLDVGVFGCQGLLKLVAFFKIWMAVFGYRGIWTVWFSDLALEALFRTSGFFMLGVGPSGVCIHIFSKIKQKSPDKFCSQ